MNKHLSFFFLIVFGFLINIFAANLKAQCLEQIDMSPTAAPQDNFVTGINNAGFITGYATMGPAPFHSVGFVMDDKGKRSFIQPSMLGPSYTDVEIQGINDSNVILIRALTGTQSDIYKGYYQGYQISKQDSFNFVKVSGNQEPTLAIPYGINNRNDITGWYKGGANKWIFVIHDSLPLNGNTWNAYRYGSKGVYLNSLGTNTNDNGLTCGFYEDGSTYAPFIYDNIKKSYLVLNTGFRMKLWGINNSEILVGEFERTSGYNQGFWGRVKPSGVIEVHSLHSIFLDDSIQSVARAINQNGEIVGSFLHPKTGKWVGFIYRPNQNEYRLPGFSFARDRWSLENSDSASIGVWTKNYYQNFNYYRGDPYSNSAIPVMDSFIIHTIHKKHIDSSFTPSYLGLAEERDRQGIGLSSNPADQNRYQHFIKPLLVTKWMKHGQKGFHGYCYGFTYSALQRYLDPAKFQTWSGLPATIMLPQMPNTNPRVVKTIERYYIKQFDSQVWAREHDSIVLGMYEGLYRIKMDFNKTYATCNPRGLIITLGKGAHSILPYKIHTPQILPFDYPVQESDSLFVYDSNYPTDSTQMFLIPNWAMGFGISQARNWSYGNLKRLYFNTVGVREATDIKQHSAFKAASPSIGQLQEDIDDSMLSISLGGTDLYYNINGSGGTHATLDNNGFSNNIPQLNPVTPQEITDTIPTSFYTDTSNHHSFTTYHYTDSAMRWSAATSVTRTMSLTRDALPGESDNGSISAHQIAYGSHDAVSKSLSGSLIETDAALSKGANILVDNLTVTNGDSLLTENPAPYIYKVTRIGGTGGKYNLWLYAIMGDSVKEFKSDQITLDANTSHVITPYFQGQHGSQVAVLVDHGNTGNYTDTLFVKATLGVPEPSPSGSIHLSPNPVADLLTIAFAEQTREPYIVTITDEAGRTLESRSSEINAQKIEIPTLRFPPGVYFVRIANKNGRQIFTDKFLKQ